ncbi:Hypothetical protein SSCIU_00263 [Mammaliicoccus sciuri]|nr:Hypothetical protein SSCIU_00263 [Mammaliicoccus sciuri]
MDGGVQVVANYHYSEFW